MAMSVLVISCDEVPALLPMPECIDLMADALRAYSAGQCTVPLRSIVWLPDRTGGLGLMPGYLAVSERPDGRALGLKIVTVFPKNMGTPYESHQGAVMLFDVENGRLLTIIDGCEITTIRTAAVSGLATRLLARAEASSLAILGTGTQARSHLEAMLAARPVTHIRVWGRNRDRAEALAQRESARHGIPIDVAETAEQAVREADIICTVTAAREPILKGQWLKPGAHINAVGACVAVARELDTEAVRRSRLFVDSRESASNEAGDYLIPLNAGVIEPGHIAGELGELLLGRIEGRRDDDEITLFKSLGLAVEDLAAARHIYAKALLSAHGREVTIGGLRHAGA